MPPDPEYLFFSPVESMSVVRKSPGGRGSRISLEISASLRKDGLETRVKAIFDAVVELKIGDFAHSQTLILRIEDIRSWGLEDLKYKVFEEENEFLDFSCGTYSIEPLVTEPPFDVFY